MNLYICKIQYLHLVQYLFNKKLVTYFYLLNVEREVIIMKGLILKYNTRYSLLFSICRKIPTVEM